MIKQYFCGSIIIATLLQLESCLSKNASLYLYWLPCQEGVASQQFGYDSDKGTIEWLSADDKSAQLCAVSTGTNSNDPIGLFDCDSSDSNQKWTYNSIGQFESSANTCLDIGEQVGPIVDEWTCKSSSDSTVANQVWTINSTDNTLRSKLNELYCLTAQAEGCPYDDWPKHRLKVDFSMSYSLINATTPGVFVNESKYGMEGGQILLVNDTFYLFITEFTGDPLYVPSNLTLWSITMEDFLAGNVQWRKIETLFQSGGTCDCNSTRASLGSSISAAFNTTDNYWYIFYVGFESCDNDAYFVNRNGRIFFAKSQVEGYTKGIEGPYEDIGVIIKYPDPDSQPWEGLQGVDSFSNPFKVNSSHYYAFYGSAQTEDNPCCNQEVGLAYSLNGYYGPWIRAAYPEVNPVRLMDSPLEQPIVIEFDDGTYGAVWDALYQQSNGEVGYSWSPDGVHWNTDCMQLLVVNPPSGDHWGDGRTPEGLIPINETHFYLFFTGWDETQASNYESFGYVIVSWEQEQ